MNNEMKRRNAKRLAGSALALAATLACGSAPAHPENSPYTVGVIVDAAKGRTILAEKYESAISKLQEKETAGLEAFFVANNLCVAYLKTGDPEKAVESCNTAVNTIESYFETPRARFGDSGKTITYRRYLAIALSNRGVVLVMNGSTEQAREDFLAALELRSDAREPEMNLARLDLAG